MAISSLFALLDDITTILDDVATMTKVATQKTAGVLGDDLALNAQQVSGVDPDRELPVVWAVAKGSLINKSILVPAALAISALAPWGILPLLMLGGLFLCYEGVEKLAHKFLHKEEVAAHQAELAQALTDPTVDFVALEKDKIKGAVRTDFILSAEIIVISLGTVASEAFGLRVAVLIGIALIMTIGVYGLVAGIVKLDDFGLYLSRKQSSGSRALGTYILRAAPYLMKFLSIAGTLAMFLVGGGIVAHGIEPLHHAIEHAGELGGVLGWLVPQLGNLLIGLVAGAIVLAIVTLVRKLWSRKKAKAEPA
jgi:predicted DNA repair protein MutK